MTITDYHDFTTLDTPKADRRRLGVGDIYLNAARCLTCEDVPRSRNRHDFRNCRCGAIAVDGGSWYCRRSFADDAQWEDRCVMYRDAVDAPR